MQTFARDGYTADEIRRLLTGPDPVYGFGCDLLTDDGWVDISDDVAEWSVERSMYADVHGACDITLYRDIVWGVDRLRPWFTVDGVKFYQGVFLFTSPERQAGQTPSPRPVSGMDKLWLLQREVGDTYTIDAGVSYLDAIRTVLDDAGVDGKVLLSGDRQETLLDAPCVWLLTDEPTSWLRVVNDLLAQIGYRGLWVDELGQFRSQPYRSPSELGPEWTFDLTDKATDVVGEERTLSEDKWREFNWWRFVRRQEAKPTVGAGIYEPDINDEATAPLRRKVRFFDAADQDALVSQGDEVVASDVQNTRVLTITTAALPVAGHFDVVQVDDPVLPVGKCQARFWKLNSDGSQEWELEVL